MHKTTATNGPTKDTNVPNTPTNPSECCLALKREVEKLKSTAYMIDTKLGSLQAQLSEVLRRVGGYAPPQVQDSGRPRQDAYCPPSQPAWSDGNGAKPYCVPTPEPGKNNSWNIPPYRGDTGKAFQGTPSSPRPYPYNDPKAWTPPRQVSNFYGARETFFATVINSILVAESFANRSPTGESIVTIPAKPYLVLFALFIEEDKIRMRSQDAPEDEWTVIAKEDGSHIGELASLTIDYLARHARQD